MSKNQKLAILFTLFALIGCIKQERSNTTLIQPILPMNIGEVREFMTNGLSIIFKRTVSDTFSLSLFILGTDDEIDSSISDLDELILRASLIKTENDTIIHLSTLQGFNVLTVRSPTFDFEFMLPKMINVFYNQSFDSLLIDSLRIGSLSAYSNVSDEDLQRYHADKFVTSRILCIIDGNFSYETVKNAAERSFFGKTIGEFDQKSLKYPENPFFLNVGSAELYPDSTVQERYYKE